MRVRKCTECSKEIAVDNEDKNPICFECLMNIGAKLRKHEFRNRE